MFLLYHSDRCNTSETVFHWCYINDLYTTHAVVCWVTTLGIIFFEGGTVGENPTAIFILMVRTVQNIYKGSYL
jgi:hypothetical protein